jgi:hypothetical protein
MTKKTNQINIIEKYIHFIVNSNLSGNKLLKKEYPGVIEHDEKDLEIAKEIYRDLKSKCIEYQNGSVDSKMLSDFCANIMYSKYSPKIVSKIVSDEIFDALDYISELDFNKESD